MKSIKRKLRDSGGVTLVEMLCAVVILILLGLLLNTGLQMAVRSYLDVTAESETQLLLSTLTDALSDKLRYSTVYVKEDGTYSRTSIGEITLDNGTTGKVLVGGKNPLPDGAYRHGKYEVTTAAVTPKFIPASGPPTDCYFTVELEVQEASGNISAGATLTVRCLNPPKKEGPT